VRRQRCGLGLHALYRFPGSPASSGGRRHEIGWLWPPAGSQGRVGLGPSLALRVRSCVCAWRLELLLEVELGGVREVGDLLREHQFLGANAEPRPLPAEQPLREPLRQPRPPEERLGHEPAEALLDRLRVGRGDLGNVPSRSSSPSAASACAWGWNGSAASGVWIDPMRPSAPARAPRARGGGGAERRTRNGGGARGGTARAKRPRSALAVVNTQCRCGTRATTPSRDRACVLLRGVRLLRLGIPGRPRRSRIRAAQHQDYQKGPPQGSSARLRRFPCGNFATL